MNHRKKNQKEAQTLALDLKQKEEIDQKVEYYKSILKAHEDLELAIQKRIKSMNTRAGIRSVFSFLTKPNNHTDDYDKQKLIIEQLEVANVLYEKKKFFEMWLKRSSEYDRKFALITEEYNKNFPTLLEKARELSGSHLRIAQILDRYDKEADSIASDQKALNELYLLLRYEIGRATGNLKFAVE
jgi:hypothetical protein